MICMRITILLMAVLTACDSAQPADNSMDNLTVENLIVDDVDLTAGDKQLEAPSESVAIPSPPVAPTTKVPVFDTIAHCRQVSEVGGSGSYTIEETCRRMESEARAEVAGRPIPDRVYDHCKQVAEVSGPGSYTIFKTCVEMELDAASRL